MPKKQAPVENEIKVKEEVKEEAKEEVKKESPKRKRSPPKQKEPKEDVLAKVKQGLKDLLALC
jgi:hypothetical protein